MSAPLRTTTSTICRLEQRTLIHGTVQSTLKLCSVSVTGTCASDSCRWYMREASSARKEKKHSECLWGKQLLSTQETWKQRSCADWPTHLLHAAVVLEELRPPQLVEMFSTWYGSRWFNTVFTTAHHLPLSWARSDQFVPSHPVS